MTEQEKRDMFEWECRKGIPFKQKLVPSLGLFVIYVRL